MTSGVRDRGREATRPANHKVRKSPRQSHRLAVEQHEHSKARAPSASRRECEFERLTRLRTSETVEQPFAAWAAEGRRQGAQRHVIAHGRAPQSHLLDDDDEEADEGWLDDHAKREKKLLDEAITEALVESPDFTAINDLPPHPDADIAHDAEQLKASLAKCAIGATEFKHKFSRTQLERMVKRDLKARFKTNPQYSEHVRADVPGSDVKEYGSRGRTSSKGTFIKAAEYESGGGLLALFTGGWMRVAKDRIDPTAWSHAFGLQRKTERQRWRHHFKVTERNGKESDFEIPRESLTGNGAYLPFACWQGAAYILSSVMLRARALIQFLRFKPLLEIVRMPRVGWAEIGSHWIFVRGRTR